MSILDEIIKFKRKEVASAKKKKPLDVLKKQVLALPKKKPVFLKRLRKKKGFSVIAEIKKKSPSKGLISQDFKPVRIAKKYKGVGASAISVLTDEKFFGGSADVLKKVKRSVSLPVLRKDFIVDEYQLFESRLMGADAVLLIAGVLTGKELEGFYETAKKIGLDALFEVHTRSEIEKILPLKPGLVGINNRDLNSFRVDIGVTAKLIKFLPKNVFVVSESGIRDRGAMKHLKALGVGAFLVGETLMKEKDPGKALKKLLGK